jgi:hypothetical protein
MQNNPKGFAKKRVHLHMEATQTWGGQSEEKIRMRASLKVK